MNFSFFFPLPGSPAHCMDQHQSPEHNGHLEDDENGLHTDTEEAEDQEDQANLPVSETVIQDSQAAAKRVSCILLY